MIHLDHPLLKLYLNLVGWVLLGFILGKVLPKQVAGTLGAGLFWVGVPIGIITFMRGADVTAAVFASPVAAWIAIGVGAVFAWIWIELGVSDERIRAFNQSESNTVSAWSRPTQGSFLLAMTVGNTSFLGYPVVLSIVDPHYFIWAVLYSTMGNAVGLYGFGPILAARFSNSTFQRENLLLLLIKNPGLWGFLLGFSLKSVPLSQVAESGLKACGWAIVTLSLILIGMQLSHLQGFKRLGQAATCLTIKMFVVPLVVGTGLMFFEITGAARLALVLQMAMPPSFNTVLLSEAYDLDRQLSVTSVALGSLALLVTIPLWVWLFDPGIIRPLPG